MRFSIYTREHSSRHTNNRKEELHHRSSSRRILE
ncbi:hypothetical protein L914_21528 [Phytophthora nicotianae]|uniref:Uncharacterized protein n=1 Tax=Phytophthora nicotianae TaxID=4792 RepID=W2M5G0_PHYNI|nr:hypothetical protein L914_21528 [Phytophthora nicotianae]